ncbi:MULTISPECIES: HlyD family secretion protein [Xanthomonas]|uniref:Hemolysin D n=1 Tax=Xanthomonas cucurbitae TaxID=56453 RepID=A0A2S7DWZ8_9XANT|nr:HlyD family efflux transporter periplasmic adaptor subunit [Xanthomonas cucurbitae]PPU78269.1 hemolysin D [Xanthomonas cucurbitae]QHG86419.1 HlyD family efflux transporter periplasmic adaptor subunit [Xanthomonas cucurbitae]WDM68682.1 HlyD family secretion protein [Xanthomonas cucurbitae]WDM72555.1 HlyD family secretion protein [Xanthomonas cucurbitae]WDM76337.1 HlyD family secretion protein [Xanthomonas cucurbitae]
MTTLFRREAVDYLQRNRLGPVVLRQRRVVRWCVLVVVVTVLLLVVGFFRLGFARSQTLSGTVTPAGGVIAMTTPQPGVVVRVGAVQGQTVSAGQMLFELSAEHRDDPGRPGLQAAQALAERQRLATEALEQLRAQGGLRQQAAAQSLAGLRARQQQVGHELQVLRHRLQLAERIEQRYRIALARGLVSEQFADERLADVLDQRAHGLELERERMALADAVVQAESSVRQTTVEVRAQLAVAGADLQEDRRAVIEQSAASRWEVRAPRAGRVALRPVQPGQAVGQGQRLADLLPPLPTVEVALFAPSRAAGLIGAGMPVQLRFDALPYQHYGQFAGRVVEVAAVPESPSGGAPSGIDPMYRVRVRLVGDASANTRLAAILRPGMGVRGTLELEWRRFSQWAFEPLSSLRGTLR